MSRFSELKEQHRELKSQVCQVESEMAHIVVKFDGTIAEALREGMVRLNFPAPPGLVRALKETNLTREE